MTPLIVAAKMGNADTMFVFLEREAWVNARDKDDRTPMLCAWTAKDYKKIQLLLQYGGSLDDIRQQIGSTSLMTAVSSNQAELVRLCLSAGCDVHGEDEVYILRIAFTRGSMRFRMDGLPCTVLRS